MNMTKIYFAKNLTPWMIDEIKAFSEFCQFSLVLLRKKSTFYENEIHNLNNKVVNILAKPFKKNFTIKEFFFTVQFILKNIRCFFGIKNLIFGLKAIIWFIKLDKSIFHLPCYINVQFATQASIIAYMLKEYFGNNLNYSLTYHAYDIYFNNKWFKRLVSSSQSAFSISKYNIEYVIKKYHIKSEKIQLSRLGVFYPNRTHKLNKKDQFVIGFLGWFNDKKGVRYLLKSLKILKEKRLKKQFKLLLAGDGPKKEAWLKLIAKLNITEYVEYLGVLNSNEKRRFYSSIDVFCLPSIRVRNDMEGLPVVLMEAISYNVPIISTNISGIPEICINKYNGLLIEERNEVLIAEAILKMINNQNLYQKLSKNCSESYKNYNLLINSQKKLRLLNWI